MGIKWTPSDKPFERGLLASQAEGISTSKAFETFLEVVVISIVNANPLIKNTDQWKKREEKYLRLIELWKDKTIPAQMLADLVNEMQKHHSEKKDIIGEMYEKFVSLGENGQFFTPEHVADMMAQMVGIEKDQQRVCDVACGSGKLLLGALKNNPTATLYGVDLDRRCTMMALLNCFWYGGRGTFLVGNTLTNEYSEGWQCEYGMIYELNMAEVPNEPVEMVTQPQPETQKISQQSLF